MKYKETITLNKNARGCYIIDTVKGCSYAKNNIKGCYGECYAANIAYRYKMDFTTPVERCFIQDKLQLYFEGFYDVKHENNIIDRIKDIDMPFVRIGEMGDPSEKWAHTLKICSKLYKAGKPIVIITKHWKTLTEKQMELLAKYNIIINTSISALDSTTQIKHRLTQYNRLKKYCKSILRVVTCDFNIEYFTKIQESLLENSDVLETIFRVSPSNNLISDGIINTSKKRFLKNDVLVSCRKNNIYFGDCKNCKDMCGVNIT